MEQINEILTIVLSALGGTTGLIVIARLIIAIVNAVMKAKSIKATKLNEQDKESMVASFLGALKDGVQIDMDAQLERATSNRLTSLEKQNNEIAKDIDKLAETCKLLAEGMSQFKTISSDIKNKLADNSKTESKPIEKIEVVESGVLKVEETKVEESKY